MFGWLLVGVWACVGLIGWGSTRAFSRGVDGEGGGGRVRMYVWVIGWGNDGVGMARGLSVGHRGPEHSIYTQPHTQDIHPSIHPSHPSTLKKVTLTLPLAVLMDESSWDWKKGFTYMAWSVAGVGRGGSVDWFWSRVRIHGVRGGGGVACY